MVTAWSWPLISSAFFLLYLGQEAVWRNQLRVWAPSGAAVNDRLAVEVYWLFAVAHIHHLV